MGAREPMYLAPMRASQVPGFYKRTYYLIYVYHENRTNNLLTNVVLIFNISLSNLINCACSIAVLHVVVKR